MFLPFVIVLLLISNKIAAEKDLACNIDRLDKCGEKFLSFLSESINGSVTKEKVLLKCREKHATEVCVRRYTQKCVKPFPRQYLNLFMKRVSASFKSICESEQSIEKFITHTACLHNVKGHTERCSSSIIKDLISLRVTDKAFWIQTSCCIIGKITQCTMKEIEKNCKKEDIEYYSKIIFGLTSDRKDLLCYEYEYGKPKCNSLMGNLPPLNGTVKKKVTLFSLVLGLLEDFIDD